MENKKLAYTPQTQTTITDIFQFSPEALSQLVSWMGQNLPSSVPISQLQGYGQLLEASRTVAGIIPAAGTTPTAGSGFTYTHTDGTGVYVFTFTTVFANTPAVLVSSKSTAGFFTPSAVSTSGFTVTTLNTSAAAADLGFSFLAATVA